MWYKRDLVETFIPINATPGNAPAHTSTPWAWPTNYTQLVASLPSDFVMCSAQVVIFTATTTPFQGVLRVGLGSAGSEVEIARAPYALMIAPGSTLTTLFCLTLPLSRRLIPAGTRIAIQHAASVVSVNCYVYLHGYFAEDFEPTRLMVYDQERYRKGLYHGVSNSLPDRAYTSVTSGGSAWALGSYTTFISSAVADLMIKGISLVHVTNWRNQAWSLATSPAGAGVWTPRALMPAPSYVTTPYTCEYVFPDATFVKRGEDVGLALKASAASTVSSAQLTYSELYG